MTLNERINVYERLAHTDGERVQLVHRWWPIGSTIVIEVQVPEHGVEVDADTADLLTKLLELVQLCRSEEGAFRQRAADGSPDKATLRCPKPRGPFGELLRLRG